MKRATSIALTLGMIVTVGLVQPAQAGDRYVGKRFPSFSATDAVTGKKFSLEDFRGKVVLIDFWATWCGPCMKELPNVQKAYRRYKDQGLEIVSISLDSDRKRFRSTVTSRRMTWHQVMEGGAWKTRLARKYGINSIPKMYLIDHEGVCITDQLRGSRLAPAIERALSKLPAREAPEPDAEPEEPERAKPAKEPRAAPDPLDPTLGAMLQRKVADARQSLAISTGPLSEFGRRAESIAQTIDRLDEQLPDPRDARRTRDRINSMWEDLIDLRHELFLHGLLNETCITIPSNPLDDDARTQLQAFLATKQTLPDVRRAMDRMNGAMRDVTARISSIRNSLGKLDHALERGTGSAADLESRCEHVCAEAEALAETWHDAWKRQLLATDQAIDVMVEPLERVGASLDRIDERIAACRALLEASLGDPDKVAQLEKDFHEVRNAVEAVDATLGELGLAGPAGRVLPLEPAVDRWMSDRAVRRAYLEQLDAAATVAAQWRQTVTEWQARLATFRDRFAAMRAELEDAAEQPRTLTDLRERFEALGEELLALPDSWRGQRALRR